MIWFVIPIILSVIQSILSIFGNETVQKAILFGAVALVIGDMTGIYTWAQFQSEMIEIFTILTNWIETQIVEYLKGLLGDIL